MGIFNQWSGCGGVLDILLEKDAVMPLSMIRGFQIEGQSDPEGYTVNDVYGLVGSCWKPAQLSDDIETDVKEDYALALQKARAADWEIEEQEAVEPVSLKTAAKEARAHPRRWQHMGHRPWTSNMSRGRPQGIRSSLLHT